MIIVINAINANMQIQRSANKATKVRMWKGQTPAAHAKHEASKKMSFLLPSHLKLSTEDTNNLTYVCFHYECSNVERSEGYSITRYI